MLKTCSVKDFFRHIEEDLTKRFDLVDFHLTLGMAALKSTLDCSRDSKKQRLTFTFPVPIENEKLKMELNKAKEAVERYKQIVSSQKKTIHILKEKNSSIMLQCADFTKLKMFKQLGHSRSSLMVDASLFSSFFHNGDPFLQEQTPTILTSEVISGLASNGSFRRKDPCCV
ncbi:uncharacterized protein LOC130635434 isoform X2 [Hydractinia symbiolongicarpus]|nr:uncharacterized protein LOC130635434 isoform X2 [Hydractinia symbiolongicarpus]